MLICSSFSAEGSESARGDPAARDFMHFPTPGEVCRKENEERRIKRLNAEYLRGE
ncbi:hypothetical protein B484DRAFT_410387 [Ochromonadaceae sp. CCMP2298]|nr:hypothetical protein B484DRAFT_410387 [Ochromonadaceae sp. CCMP2298]